MNKKGYSLIELTIVVGLVALLAVGISSIVLSSIIQASRIRNQIKSRQAGDYALGQIQTLIRNAREISSCDSSNNTLSIINLDGRSTTFLLESVSGNTSIASNSGYYLTPTDVTVTNFDVSCSPNDITPNVVKLSFDLKRNLLSPKSKENPLIHYETSITLRNN